MLLIFSRLYFILFKILLIQLYNDLFVYLKFYLSIHLFIHSFVLLCLYYAFIRIREKIFHGYERCGDHIWTSE